MLSCSTCGSSLNENATFCAQCGARTAPQAGNAGPQAAIPQLAIANTHPAMPATPLMAPLAPVSPNAMAVCVVCGTIAPTETDKCTGCGAHPRATAYVEPRADGVMFAQVLESDFQCRSCGLRATLDSFCFESEVDCQRCGVTQAFDVTQWGESMAHAHAVADLSGPPPEGQGWLRHGQKLRGENPFKTLGVGFTFAELTQSGMTISSAGMVQRTLRVRVSTGHPVCHAGHGPFAVELDAQGSTIVRCPVCNDSATYALPAKATEFAKGCVGVIDDEHRKDRSVVRFEASSTAGGAIALTCPRCSAALPATQSTVVDCQYCHTTSYVPKRALFKLNPSYKGRPFWLLFRGPSVKRVGEEGEEEPPTTSAAPKPPAPQAAAAAPPVAATPVPPVVAQGGFRPWMAIVAGLALVVAAGLLFVLLRPHGAKPTTPPPASHVPHGKHH